MGELATLPIFCKLKGQRALVAGGSDAAAWKAELLAAAGAEVHIYAERLDPGFVELIRAGSPHGSFHWKRRPWTAASFDGMRIAVCDALSSGEARAFHCNARARGVPANIIDKPEFCAFQFGTIVNRSPVVIGISTDGAAPILGQAIRRRIEALIPPAVADWAKVARRIRSDVVKALPLAGQRRAFWEGFVDRVFGSAPDENAEHTLLAESARISICKSAGLGKVTLVGAGPGDAEFLTLKAVRALQAADVILFDDLVSDDVLELARREARRMLVGKRGGRESCKQDDINDTMISLARAGKNVVRLKGGDPVIFGRAGEEISRLSKEGIAVSVVPGITAASAMAAQLGISLTHRSHAQSVRFVTGHSQQGDLPVDVDWRAIADPRATTIFYMGGRTATKIAETLQAFGMHPDTPIAICRSISRPEQKQWIGLLSDMACGMNRIGCEQPVLIGVGDIFASAGNFAIRTGDTAPHLGGCRP